MWKMLGIPDHLLLTKPPGFLRLIGESESFEIARGLEASTLSAWGSGIYLNRKPELFF